MDAPAASPAVARPGLLRRAAAGAWHVPAGFAFLARNPRLWPLSALPALAAMVCVGLGVMLGILLVPKVEAVVLPEPGRLPEWLALPLSVLLWVATVGAGGFLGLGIALLLAAPLLDQLSRRVEARVRGVAPDTSPGLVFEVVQSMRGAVYFLIAAPGVFLLGFVPLVGPFLSLMWGARAIALQMTDPSLSRRGMRFADKRRFHREWRAESQGFGLAGMVGFVVPLANLLLGPALVTGGTLLVLDLEDAGALAPQPAPAAGPAEASPDAAAGGAGPATG
jgi:CysZ protein